MSLEQSGGPEIVQYTEACATQDPELEAALNRAVGLGNDPGLGLLLDLAKRGEYDPWNIDIVAVTDSYLGALDERLDAQDLKRVARLIFYAAALLHLKAQSVAERQKQLDYEEALAAELGEELDLLDDGLPGEGYPRLRPGDMPLEYGFLRGALPVDGGADLGGLLTPCERPLRPRGLTLVDLIVALRDYDERIALKEQELADAPRFDSEIAMEECVGSSHQDDLDQDIVDIRIELWSLLGTELGGPEGRVEIDRLLTSTRSRAAAFLALLFLAQDEEVQLEQDEFYRELHVIPGAHFGEVRAGVHKEDEDEEGAEARVEEVEA